MRSLTSHARVNSPRLAWASHSAASRASSDSLASIIQPPETTRASGRLAPAPATPRSGLLLLRLRHLDLRDDDRAVLDFPGQHHFMGRVRLQPLERLVGDLHDLAAREQNILAAAVDALLDTGAVVGRLVAVLVGGMLRRAHGIADRSFP